MRPISYVEIGLLLLLVTERQHITTNVSDMQVARKDTGEPLAATFELTALLTLDFSEASDVLFEARFATQAEHISKKSRVT